MVHATTFVLQQGTSSCVKFSFQQDKRTLKVGAQIPNIYDCLLITPPQTSAPRLPDPVVAESKISNYINNNNNNNHSHQVTIMSVARLFSIQPSKAEPVVDNKPGSGQVVPNKNTVGNVGNVGNVGAAGSELKPGAKKTVIQVRESGANTIFL